MRATQGAAAPGEMIITGPPPKPSEAGSVGRGGTVEGTSFAACGEASDPQLVPTKRAAMHAWSLPCTYSPPPPWAPRTGGAGVEGAGGAFDVNLCEASFLKRRKALRPFFLPISSGRNGGARRVGGAGGASDKNPAKPPPKKRPVPRGHPGRRMARRGRRAPRVGGYAGKRATTGRPYNVGPSYGSFAGPPSPHATRGTAAGLARGPHGTGIAVVMSPRAARQGCRAPYRVLSTPASSLKALISASSWSAWRCTSSHTVPYHRSLSSWAVRPCCSTQV